MEGLEGEGLSRAASGGCGVASRGRGGGPARSPAGRAALCLRPCLAAAARPRVGREPPGRCRGAGARGGFVESLPCYFCR